MTSLSFTRMEKLCLSRYLDGKRGATIAKEIGRTRRQVEAAMRRVKRKSERFFNEPWEVIVQRLLFYKEPGCLDIT